MASLPAVGAAHALDEESRHYLLRVCRARPGERVTVTDGRGGVAVGELVRDGGALRVRIERSGVSPAPRPSTLLCGAPEGERADWLVEKLAELGVGTLQPVDTSRARWERFGRRVERLRRLAVAALRQSLRDRLLEILAPRPLVDVLAGLPEGGVRWLAGQRGTGPGEVPDGAGPVLGIVGPSAGLTEAEIGACVAEGFLVIRLSEARLRTETAAVALAARWAAARGSGAYGGSPASDLLAGA
jgi:16S rRNA (uracil1498-N3)-methyltransferase